MNALTHGLAANTLVLATESPEECQALLDSFLVEMQPVGPIETALVHRMAAAAWRLRRYDGVETGTLDLQGVAEWTDRPQGAPEAT